MKTFLPLSLLVVLFAHPALAHLGDSADTARKLVYRDDNGDFAAHTVTIDANLVNSNLTATTVPYLDASKVLKSSAVTPTELGYVSGVTSALQTQLNAKAPSSLTSAQFIVGNGSNAATGVAMSGDASLANTGAVTVSKVAGAATNAAFVRTCQITSAAAATAVHCLTDADVSSGKSAYISTFRAKVNGGTVWATTATCAIQDTNGSPVAFVTFAAGDMTANAVFFPSSIGASGTYGDAYILDTGSTASKGLDIKCNANGTGSTFVVTIAGVIK